MLSSDKTGYNIALFRFGMSCISFGPLAYMPKAPALNTISFKHITGPTLQITIHFTPALKNTTTSLKGVSRWSTSFNRCVWWAVGPRVRVGTGETCVLPPLPILGH